MKPKNGTLRSDTGTILQMHSKLRVGIVEEKELTAQRNCTDLQKFIFCLSEELLP